MSVRTWEPSCRYPQSHTKHNSVDRMSRRSFAIVAACVAAPFVVVVGRRGVLCEAIDKERAMYTLAELPPTPRRWRCNTTSSATELIEPHAAMEADHGVFFRDHSLGAPGGILASAPPELAPPLANFDENWPK